VSGKEIEKNQNIDRHYYSIASKATLLEPKQLNVNEVQFKEKFGEEWKGALAAGKREVF
jgi:hypothetical protein